MNEEPKTPTKITRGTKKRKIATTTPPRQGRFSDNDITTETILKSPEKQSSTYFNNSSHQNHILTRNSQAASDSTSGASSRGRLQIGNEKDTDKIVQGVSPYRKLSPSRKERSQSPTNNSKRLSLVQLSPKRKNNKLQQLNHAIQQENINLQTGGRRLYIYKLTLTNFKSYANEQIIGPFNENFTAVVGPNGSGKSNVIDSMLFVFGFRANKLRQGKLSELIHKSEAYPDLNFCSVDVHFQYNYKDQNIANQKYNDELVITRKAFKNNSSKYYVNGKESTYTKVTELLKEEGIDLDHKRFLILQGEVESIAQMKPKAERNGDDGILEYLEDIIGTSKYKGEIETSITKIEELNDICVEKNNRLKIVERELKSLEAGKDTSIEYLKIEKQYCVLRANLCQHKQYSAREELTSIELKKVKAEQELKVTRAKQNEIESLASEFNESIEQTATQIQTLKEEEKSINETLNSVVNEKIEAEENKKNNERTQEKNKNLLELNKKKLELSFKEMEDSKLEMDSLIEKISDLNSNIDKEKNIYEIERASLQQSSQHLSQQIGELEQELEPSQQKIVQLTSTKTLKNQEIDLLKEREQKSNETKKILESKKALAEKTLGENESLLSSLFSNLASIESTLENKNKVLNEAGKSFQIINDSYMKQKQQILESKNALSSSENSSKVIKALSKLQDEGKISGFHGRLGNLGVINAQYDVAISTAAPRMNDILVDSVECAQKCIEHLRSYKLGYARFILLDKLPNFNKSMNQSFNFLPKGAFRLFDLIKPAKSEFLPAFYSVVRDTIATDSLSQANNIAYEGNRRFRVVTLDGKLIDISGTMSGGGKQKSKGLMRLNNKSKNDESTFENLFISAEQIKNLEKKFQETETEFETANFAVSQEKNAIEKLENEIPNMKVKISSLQFEITNLENEIVNCKKQLTQFTEHLNKNKSTASEKVESLLSAIASINYEINSIENNVKPKTEIIASLKEEINQLGGIQLEDRKKNIVLMEKQLTKSNHSLKKNKALIRKKEIETERLDKSIASITKNLECASTDLLKYDQVIAECIDKSTSLGGKKEKVFQTIDNLKKKKEKLLIDVGKYEQELSFHLKRESALNLELEECINKKEKMTRTLEKEDRVLEDLKIRDVYESLQVLGCLPSSSIEISDAKSEKSKEEIDFNDELMEIEQEAANEKAEGEIENDEELDKMEIEKTDSLKLEVENENVNLQSPNHSEIPISHKQYLKLPILSKEESDEIDKTTLEEEILVLKQQLDSYTVNILILEDYVVKFKSFKQKEEELKDSIGNRDEVKEKSEQLKKQRYQEFMIGFNIISQSLKEMYQMITMGGNAELELVDSIDPFSEGILFSVMPPKKSWRNISNLSGGEKTLSSLALVFALHNYKPTPIYIMDEIDAALDFRNVSIVANYIKDRTKDAQFIVISLRNNMFELSERLVGIYKNQNMTRSTTLENVDFIH